MLLIMDNCIISNASGELAEKLREKLKKESLVNAFMGLTTDKEFLKVNEDFDKLSLDEKISRLDHWYQLGHADASLTVQDKDYNLGNFATTSEKQYAKGFVTGIVQKQYMRMIQDKQSHDNEKVQIVSKKDVVDATLAELASIASSRAKSYHSKVADFFNSENSEEVNPSNCNSVEDYISIISTEYKNGYEKTGYILGTSNDIHDKFWSHLMLELSSEEGVNNFFDEVSSNPSIRWFNKMLSDNSEDIVYGIDEVDFNGDEIDDVDVYTSIFGDRTSFGLYGNVVKHINDFVRAYISTLPKAKYTTNFADGSFAIDTDNLAQSTEYLDAQQVISVLFFNTDKSSIGNFIESIDKIAKRVPGLEGLHYMAMQCREDDSLAYYFHTIFAKNAVRKSMIEKNSDNYFNSKLSNAKANRFYANRNAFVDILKDTSLRHDTTVISELRLNKELGTLARLIDDYDKFSEDEKKDVIKNINNNVNKFIESLSNVYRHYLPSITKTHLSAFIMSEGLKNSANRIDVLLKATNSLISAAKQTNRKYFDEKAKADELFGEYLKYTNEEIDVIDSEDSFKREGKIRELKQNYQKAYANVYANYITSSLFEACSNLSDLFSDYIVTNGNLNSMDAHNNLSADVLNDSYLGFISYLTSSSINSSVDATGKVVVNKEYLTNFGKLKFGSDSGTNIKNHQYDYSNILLSHTIMNDAGKPVKIKGLFEKTEDGFIISDNASEILKIDLFNGARNQDSGDGVSYNEMVRNDFAISAVVQFFRSLKDNAKGNETTLAKYFIRIPSDAPNIYTVSMPHYETGAINVKGSLLTYSNGTEDIQKLISLFESNINRSDENAKDKLTALPIQASLASNILVNKKNLDIFIGKISNIKSKDITEDGVTKQLYRFHVKNSKGENCGVLYFTGNVITKSNKNKYLTDAKFHHAEVMTIDETNELGSSIISRLSNNAFVQNNIKLKCNRNHIVFSAYRNMLMQELTNAGKALYDIFETDTIGDKTIIRIENGQPVVKQKYIDNPSLLINNYHTDSKGRIFTEKDGIKKLAGNVFNSNKFTVFYPNGESSKNVNFADYLFTRDESKNVPIDFLYGGVESGLALKVKDGQFVGIELNYIQKDAVDTVVDNFITSYSVQAAKRFSEFESVFNNSSLQGLYSINNIVDFVLNYRIAFNNMDDLFYGDTKFYKKAQDVLKRAKEVVAGGIPVGIKDYSVNLIDSTVPVKSILDKENGGDGVYISYNVDGVEKRKKVVLRNKYNSITIKNTESFSISARNLERDLVRMKVMSKEQARNYMKNFEKTDVNDGQSYITFEEWIKRITIRGEYPKYKWLIDKISRREKLNPSEITEFIQVQKNFSYEMIYDKQFNINRPVQIKNAEFVLIPQFTEYVDENGDVQKTELGKLNDWMMENDIAQVNTSEASKASKKCEIELFDENGVADWDKFEKEFNTVRNEGGITEHSYNFIYRQLETPQHVDDVNKAGVQIMKKIIDNISDDSPLKPVKDLLQDLYSSNIENSFELFAEEINMIFDKNEKLKTDEYGNISFDLKNLYSKLREEAKRLGINSNEIEYLTIDDNTGLPVAPLHFTSFVSKFESIVQSMINRRITRQTLPGFHAAQVAGLGITEKFVGKEGGIKKASATEYGNKLHYHPDGQNYIEVVVPRFSIFDNISDEKIFEIGKDGLNMLEREGLDKFIGYRIPTEGKQSIAVMKIVGFVDKSQGSTIIVPDDWVAQTGADFDIDSIYAINYNMFKDSKGNIRRAKYNGGTLETDIENRYIEYAKDYIRRHKKNSNFLKEHAAILDDISKAIASAHISEDIAYNSLSDEEKAKIDEIMSNKDISYKDRINSLLEKYSDYSGSDEFNEVINSYKTIAENFDIQNIENNKRLIDTIKENAERLGLVDYDTFSNWNISKQNTREARNAGILDCMLKIMSDKSILEEQLAQSHCRDIMNAKDNVTITEERKAFDNRSQYDFYDQILWQDDCMSGATLKAFSVSRDTFCSICNKIRPTLSQGFRVIYDSKSEDGKGYTLEELSKHYDNVGNTEYGYVVTHDKLGWSKDNRNIDGYYITVYSSETTAYHLDAVKIGGIPNLNTYTFGVYKTFIDMGSNYNVALAFIKQPGISRVINCWQRGLSIFNKDYNTAYVDTAIKDLASANDIKILDKETNISHEIDIYTNVDDVLNELNNKEIEYNGEKTTYLELYKDVVLPMLGLNKDEIKDFKFALNHSCIKNLPFSEKLMLDRLNDRGIFSSENEYNNEIKTMFDLTIMLQFHTMNAIVNNIENYSRICSPDKFGAKQTAFATDKIINDIRVISENTEKANSFYCFDEDGNPISMLNAIYPGFDFENKTDDEAILDFIQQDNSGKSSYKSLYSFFKYATCTSCILNSSLFNTQKPEYKNRLYRIADELNVNIYEDLYNEFKAYSNSYILIKRLAKSSSSEDFSWNTIRYMLALDKPIFETVDVKDINNPTAEELNMFSSMSPANKVNFIQQHFENGLIFDYLKTNIYNSSDKSKIPMQTISLNYDTVDIEVLFDKFRNAYYNDNPFISEAAVSLIDYALLVEHFKIRRNGISRIITNDVLRDCGYMDMFDINNEQALLEFTDDVYTSFIRSHSDLVKKFVVPKNSDIREQLSERINGRYRPVYLGETSNSESYGRKIGLVDENGNYRNYLRMVLGKEEILMKAYEVNSELFYYPINVLESYEFSNWSANEKNNIHYDEESYRYYCENYSSKTERLKEFTSEHRYSKNKNKYSNQLFNIQNIANSKDDNARNQWAKNIISTIENYYSKEDSNIAPLFFISTSLGDFKFNSHEEMINGKNYAFIRVPYRSTNLSGSDRRTQLETLGFIKGGKRNSYGVREYFGNGRASETSLSELNKSFADVVRSLRNNSEAEAKSLAKNVFMVVQKDNGVRHSTVKDFTTAILDINNAREREIAAADKIISDLRRAGVNTSSTESINQNKRRVSDSVRRYVNERASEFIDRAESFMEVETEDGAKLVSIDNSSVMNKIIEDRDFRNKYLKFILEYDKFCKDYNHFLDYDSSDEDAQIDNNVKIIQTTIRNLINNKNIAASRKMFAIDYFKSISTDPLIREDIFAITEGYNNVSSLESWITSSLEAGVPIMQIIIKDVLSEVEGKTMQGKIFAENFIKKINNLKASGPFSWNNLIDEYGYWHKPYVNELRNVLYYKQKELADIANDPDKGKFTIEYFKKLHDYNIWKNKNFHQRFVKEYYDEINKNEEEILNTYPEIFVEYNKLQNEYLVLTRSAKFGENTEDEEHRIKELQDEIVRLDGSYKVKGAEYSLPKLGEPDSTRIHCKEASDALFDYLTKKRNMSAKYCKQEDIEEFNSILDTCLRTMSKYEQRNVLGYPAFSTEDLMNIPEYAKAYKWVNYNAKQVLDDKELAERISNAYEKLKLNSENSYNDRNNTFWKIVRESKAKDIYGIVDGRKLTDEQRAKIKRSQLNRFSSAVPRLITPLLNKGVVFSNKFYQGLSGLTGKATLNSNYVNTVKSINDILSNAYNESTKDLDLSLLSVDEINDLIKLYDILDGSNGKGLRKYNRGKQDRKLIKSYMDENVEFEIDYDAVASQKLKAEYRNNNDPEFREAFKKLLNRKINIDGTEKYLPNRFLFTYQKPKANIVYTYDENGYLTEVSGDGAEFVDIEKTNALKTIRENVRQIPNHYYWKAMHEAEENGTKEQWMKDNHIYNPYLGKTVPIECWTTEEYYSTNKDGNSGKTKGYHWESKHESLTRTPKDKYTNKKYIEGKNMMLSNYDSENGEYNNKNVPVLSEAEKAVKEEVQKMIAQYVPEDNPYIKAGGVPVKANEGERDAKWFAKQTLGAIGWYDNTELPKFTENLEYGEDGPVEIPMLSQLKGKFGDIRTRKPFPIMTRAKFEGTDAEYYAYKSKLEDDNRKIQEDNEIVHKALMNRDWDNVFKEFIIRASRSKAIADNQYMLYYGLNTLKEMSAYHKPLGLTNYKKNKKASTTEETVYNNVPMNDAVSLMQTLMRRLLFDQHKRNHGFLTRAMNMVQMNTSATLMMGNITGGAANVTYGITQAWQETIAKQFMDSKDWAFGTKVYSSGTPSYILDSFTGKPSCKASAIVKLFNLIEPDDFAQIGRLGVNETLKKTIQNMYILNTGGEHMMQNTALFALMHSHRIVPKFVNNKVVDFDILTKEEYLRNCETEALEFTLEQYPARREIYNRFKSFIKSDKNVAKDYVLRRKEIITSYLENLKGDDAEEIRKFYISTKKGLENKLNSEWNNLEDVYSQFEFNDKKELVFSTNSILTQIEDSDLIWRKLGDLRQKAFSINQKIHGVYDRLGAARFEETWIGGVIMQFHKHIYPGIMKRYRWNGYYNEIRHSVEKGSFTALIDFLHIDFDTIKNRLNLSDDEVNTYKALQSVSKYISEYIPALKSRWQLLSNAERQNIIRNFTDVFYLALAFGISVALRMIWDDKDKEDSLAYNLLIRTIDRTELELMLYGAGIPGYGPINETKTLWTSPSASLTIFDDTYDILELSTMYLLGYDDLSFTYQRGLHKDENKYMVALKKHIPVYRGINYFLNLPNNNRAYARKSNPLEKLAKDYSGESK